MKMIMIDRAAMWSLLLLGVVSFPGASSEEELEELWPFVTPTPEDFNLTEADWNQTTGYNIWMPQYHGGDPSKKTFVMMTGGCLPVEEGGSFFYQDAAVAFNVSCTELGVECKCRPVIEIPEWNVVINQTLWPPFFHDMHHCSWEIRRILDEHRRGVINVAGISAKCDFRHPQIYDEARELGVPIFLLGANPLTPEDEDYGVPGPEGYIGTDQVFLGQTMARVLKQLAPRGSVYGFIMQWDSPFARTIRDAFNEELEDDLSNKEDRATWNEVKSYPYESPYNYSYYDCHHMTCAMEGLIHSKSNVDTMIFLYETPLRNDNFTNWVDSYRDRELTLIAKGTIERIDLLNTGYIQGLVGEISFEMGTRSAEVLVKYDTNRRSGRMLTKDERFFPTKLISYSVIPADLDAVNFDPNLLDGLEMVGYTAYGIVVATSIVCTFWAIVNRNAIIVRTAQPFFLLVLIAGIVMLASTIIPMSFDDNGDPDSMAEKFGTGVCMSQPWLAFTGFSIIFSALFSKTWRVNRVFHAQRDFSRVQISPRDVLGPFAVIFTSNCILLSWWTALDPLTYQRLDGVGLDYWNRKIESYGACRSDMALAFLVPLALINFATLGVACWQAFEARNIQSAFSESTYIGYAVASLFQAFLTGFPIVVVVKDDPRAYYLVLMLMIFVLCEGILLLIFLPKMLLARRFSKMSEADQKKEISDQIALSSNFRTPQSVGSRSRAGNVNAFDSSQLEYKGHEGNAEAKEETKEEDVVETDSGTKSENLPVDLGKHATIGSSASDVAAAVRMESSGIPAFSSITVDSQINEDQCDESDMKTVPVQHDKDEATASDHTAKAGTSS